jgi:hypothetical protein
MRYLNGQEDRRTGLRTTSTGWVSSGLSLRHRYHSGILLRTSEYFHWKGFAVFWYRRM